MWLKKLIYPEFYQGHKKTKHYFEGWYFKLVTQDQKQSIALIPGMSKNNSDPHAFIQVFIVRFTEDQPVLKTYYLRFPTDAFSYRFDRFEVQIGQNIFTKTSISLNLCTDEITLIGEVMFDGITPIKKTLIAPNIMGFFGYFTFMECYHGILSMSHNVSGHINYNQHAIDLTYGKGYTEKDWGKSFPREYVWMQTNHFSHPFASFMLSYADIPFMKAYFKGLICVLTLDQKEYRFATYNFSKVKLEEISQDAVRYQIKKGRYTLNVYATKDLEVELPSPKNGVMNQTIKEGLSGKVSVLLLKGKKIIFQDLGTSSGLEIMKPINTYDDKPDQSI